MIPWAEMMEYEELLVAVHTREMQENEIQKARLDFDEELEKYTESFPKDTMTKIIVDVITFGILSGVIIWAVHGLAK